MAIGKVKNNVDSSNTHTQVRFFEPEDLGPRDWGKETLVGHGPGLYTGKILEMRAGAKGGLQRHHLKNECGYIVQGTLIFRYDPGDGTLREKTLKAGDCVHIPPGAVHQEEAVTDCVIFEVSTPHFNDRVRMEKHYGLECEGGLPSTSLDEVETR
jgi:mannose-6-phosphate isomerase-like protein (cupin superfamily)